MTGPTLFPFSFEFPSYAPEATWPYHLINRDFMDAIPTDVRDPLFVNSQTTYDAIVPTYFGQVRQWVDEANGLGLTDPFAQQTFLRWKVDSFYDTVSASLESEYPALNVDQRKAVMSTRLAHFFYDYASQPTPFELPDALATANADCEEFASLAALLCSVQGIEATQVGLHVEYNPPEGYFFAEHVVVFAAGMWLDAQTNLTFLADIDRSDTFFFNEELQFTSALLPDELQPIAPTDRLAWLFDQDRIFPSYSWRLKPEVRAEELARNVEGGTTAFFYYFYLAGLDQDLSWLRVQRSFDPFNPVVDQAAVADTAFAYEIPAWSFLGIDATQAYTTTATLASGAELPAWLDYDATLRRFAGTPQSADQGVFSILVSANNLVGALASESFVLTVTDEPSDPTLTQTPAPLQAFEDTLFAMTLPVGLFVDPDFGDSLQYEASLVGGAPLPVWLQFNPVGRTFQGTPTQSDVGQLTLLVRATDLTGRSVSTTIPLTVTATNDTPTVVMHTSDSSAVEGIAWSHALPATLFADVDPGDQLTMSATGASGTVLPAWVTVDFPNRRVFGTPPIGSAGVLTVELRGADSAGATVVDPFQVRIVTQSDVLTFVNTLPGIGVEPGSTATALVASNAVTYAGNRSDLTWTARLANGAPLPSWITFQPATQTLTVTPGDFDLGLTRVVVRVAEPLGLFREANWDINVSRTNRPPRLVGKLLTQNATEEVPFQFTLPAGLFVDDPEDTITLTVSTITGGPLPSWLQWDAGAKKFFGTPLNQHVGDAVVRIRATDNGFLSSNGDFLLRVANVNDPPTVLGVLDPISTFEDAQVSWSAPTGFFRDIDPGDRFTYTAKLADGAPLPNWLNMNATTGVLFGVPSSSDLGHFTIVITATDTGASAVSANLELDVYPNPTPAAVRGFFEADDHVLAGKAIAGKTGEQIVLLNSSVVNDQPSVRVLDSSSGAILKDHVFLGSNQWTRSQDRSFLADLDNDFLADLVLIRRSGHTGDTPTGPFLRAYNLNSGKVVREWNYETETGAGLFGTFLRDLVDPEDQVIAGSFTRPGASELLFLNRTTSQVGAIAIRILDLKTGQFIDGGFHDGVGFAGWLDDADEYIASDTNFDGQDDLVIVNRVADPVPYRQTPIGFVGMISFNPKDSGRRGDVIGFYRFFAWNFAKAGENQVLPGYDEPTDQATFATVTNDGKPTPVIVLINSSSRSQSAFALLQPAPLAQGIPDSFQLISTQFHRPQNFGAFDSDDTIVAIDANGDSSDEILSYSRGSGIYGISVIHAFTGAVTPLVVGPISLATNNTTTPSASRRPATSATTDTFLTANTVPDSPRRQASGWVDENPELFD